MGPIYIETHCKYVCVCVCLVYNQSGSAFYLRVHANCFIFLSYFSYCWMSRVIRPSNLTEAKVAIIITSDIFKTASYGSARLLLEVLEYESYLCKPITEAFFFIVVLYR